MLISADCRQGRIWLTHHVTSRISADIDLDVPTVCRGHCGTDADRGTSSGSNDAWSVVDSWLVDKMKMQLQQPLEATTTTMMVMMVMTLMAITSSR